jgi:hypothetical protein
MNRVPALRCLAVLFLSLAASAQSVVSSGVSSSRTNSVPSVSSTRTTDTPHSMLEGPYLRAGGSLQSSLGYSPGMIFGGGFNHRFSRALLLSDVSLDNSKKFDVDSGLSFRGGAGAYAMKRHTGFGGGARCVKLTTSVYDKAACRPFIGGVYSSPLMQFDAAYYFAGTDKINHLQGVRTVTVIPFSKHMAFEFEFGVYRFNASFGNQMYSGITSNPGIRYLF